MSTLPVLLFREHQLHLFRLKGKQVQRLDMALTTPLQLANSLPSDTLDVTAIIANIRQFTHGKPLKVLLDFQDIDCQEAKEFPRFAKRLQQNALAKRYLEQHTRQSSVAALLMAPVKGDLPILVQAGLTTARQEILNALPISSLSIAPLLLPTIMGHTPSEPTLYLSRYDSGRMRLTFYNNNQLYFTRLSPPQADYNKEVQDTIYYCRQHMTSTTKPALVTVDAEHSALPVENLHSQGNSILAIDMPLLLALASQKKQLPTFTGNTASMAITPIQPMAKWWFGAAAVLALLLGIGVYQAVLQQRTLHHQQQQLEVLVTQQRQFTTAWRSTAPTTDEAGEPLPPSSFTEEQQFRATLVHTWLEQQRLSYQALQRALAPLPANRYYLQSFILEKDYALASDSAVRRLLEERNLPAISSAPPTIQFGEYELSFSAPAVFAGQLTVSYDDQLNMQQLLAAFPEWLTITLEQDALDIWGGAKSGALEDIDLFDTQRLLRLTMVGYQSGDDKSLDASAAGNQQDESNKELNDDINALDATKFLLGEEQDSNNMGIGDLGQPDMADQPLKFEDVPAIDENPEMENLSPLQPLSPFSMEGE